MPTEAPFYYWRGLTADAADLRNVNPTILSALGAKKKKKSIFQKPHFLHFWASGPFGNCRGRDLELNGMIGIEICEILEFCQKFGFWVFLEVWKI